MRSEISGRHSIKRLKTLQDKDGKSPTLSVGVAIIHHLQPLREALELARSAEKSAKHVKDKNALAITISKRSGSDFTIRRPIGKGLFHEQPGKTDRFLPSRNRFLKEPPLNCATSL